MPALAAEEATESPAPPPGLVEHVQVITTKIPEPTEITPASVTVLTRKELVLRGAYDLRSALMVMAGIDISPGGDGGPAGSVPEFWGLREFDAFLLTVDGVPYGGAFNPDVAALDLEDVERVEVLRGAAPVTYGASSFVGVINVVHKAPGEGGRFVRTSGGSYGSGSVAFSSPLPEWSGVRSTLSLDAARRGFKDDRTNFDRGHVRWQNGMKIGAGSLRFGLDGFRQQQDPASPLPRVGTALTTLVPFDANLNMRDAHLDETKFTVDAVYERPMAPTTRWTTTVSLSRSRQEILRGFLTDVAAPPPNAHGFRQTIPILDAYFDTHMTFQPNSKIEFIAGIDHLHGQGHARGGDFDYTVNLDGSGAPSGDSLANESDVRIRDRREFSGLYGQTIWTPVERLHVEIGARVNRTAETRSTSSLEFAAPPVVATEDSHNVTRGAGFAGLTWTAWKGQPGDLQLFANYRNTYKPAVIDFGLDADPEILAPETAESYEAGTKSSLLSNRLAIEVSAFQMDFQNLVLSQVVGGLPSLINAGSERFRGIEVSGALHPTPAFEWRVVYSLHDARFRDFVTEFGGVPTQLAGKRLEMSARNMAATEFVYGRATGWRGSARANWVGSRWLNKRNTALAPDYITWAMGIGYAMREVEIRLDGTNLNNQRPPVAESELGDAQYYLMPARRLELSLRWTPGSAGH